MPVTLLSVGEAAQRYQLRPARLQTLIRDGKIRTVRLENEDLVPDGEEMLVDREEVESVARRLDRRQWQRLAGRKISLSDAAQRYNLRKVTLSKWARAGHIRVLERDSYRVYLDEADVNFAAALAEIANRPGRALFPR